VAQQLTWSQSEAVLAHILWLAPDEGSTRELRIFTLGCLGLSCCDTADWIQARSCSAEARSLLEGTGERPTVNLLPLLVLEVALLVEEGELEDVESRLETLIPLLGRWNLSKALRDDLSRRCEQMSDGAERKGRTSVPVCAGAVVALRSANSSSPDPSTTATDVRLASLTPAERRVLNQLATHRTLFEIAQRLYVSRATVKTHVASIYAKLGVTTRADAVEFLEGVSA
jgi:DNA-binding CsgD family transcriptional regulator